jgi:carbonic anhydrase
MSRTDTTTKPFDATRPFIKATTSDATRASAVRTGTGDPSAEPTRGLEVAIARNQEFSATGGHEGARVIPDLGLVVITCLDPRTDPAHFLGLKLSDAIVIRNVGGRVSTEVINDLAFLSQIVESIRPDGPLFEIAVIHHTQCGAGALAGNTFRQTYAERIGVAEETLRDHAIVDPAETVTIDVERLRSSPAISPRVGISGHVYDVVTGHIKTILSQEPKGILRHSL